LALADPRPMSLKEKQRMTQFTLRPPLCEDTRVGLFNP